MDSNPSQPMSISRSSPARGRHHLRRRYPLRATQHSCDPRLLQGYLRGRRPWCLCQLRQPHGDEHLGGALLRRVNTVGLCHGVQKGAHPIATLLGVTDADLDYICSGINHQTWYIDLKVTGRQVNKDELIGV